MKKLDIEIKHADKILFPDCNKSKYDIVEYYEKIAPYILPYLKNRPLTLHRFPDGILHEGFYNKHIPDYFPSFIKRISVPMRQEEKVMEMASVDTAKDLVYLAGQGVIELHIPLSKSQDLETPDQMIFDFDPSSADFENVRTAAQMMREILNEKLYPSFIKTTGSRGVHIHVPIKEEHAFSVVKAVAKEIAEELINRLPNITTLAQRKDKREGKVFIDILRNDYGVTAIAPYSLRAKPTAPIAMPISWEELKNKDINAGTFTMDNTFRRLSQLKESPWAELQNSAVSLVHLPRK
jgi:bifunctional non-homologous end joining protein LigD